MWCGPGCVFTASFLPELLEMSPLTITPFSCDWRHRVLLTPLVVPWCELRPLGFAGSGGLCVVETSFCPPQLEAEASVLLGDAQWSCVAGEGIRREFLNILPLMNAKRVCNLW